MKNFIKNQKEIIAGILFVAVFGGLINFAILPLTKKIIQLKNDVEEARVKQDLKKQRLDDLPRIRKQYSEIESQGNSIDVFLDKEKAVLLIERLEKLAQDTDNKITIAIDDTADVKAAPKSKTDAQTATIYDSLPSKDYLKLKISLIGNYGSFFRYIKSLESLEYYSDIVGITMAHANENDINGNKKSVDVLNPFSTAPTESATPAATDKLATSLEVVFYTRK